MNTLRFAFAQGDITIGQRVRTIARDALKSLLKLVEQLLAQGHSCEHLLEVLTLQRHLYEKMFQNKGYRGIKHGLLWSLATETP